MNEFLQFKRRIQDRARTLKDMIREIEELQLVESSRASRWRAHLDHAEESLQDSLLRVAVVGSVKSGKSTLINALLGRDLLKRGAGIITAFITRIRNHGEMGGWVELKPWSRVLDELNTSVRMLPVSEDEVEESDPLDIRRAEDRDRLRALIEKMRTEWRHSGGQPDAGFILLNACMEGYNRLHDQMGESATRLIFDHNSLNRHQRYVGEESQAVYLQDVELHYPLPWLGENVEIADCQGSDSPNPMHFALLQQYILRSHLILYTISSRTGLREADFKLLDFIKTLRMLPQTLFVLNVDLDAHPNAENLAQLVERVRTELHWVAPQPHLYAFSALHQLLVQLGEEAPERDRRRLDIWDSDSNLAALTESGYTSFRDQLAQRVSSQKARVLLGSGLNRLTMIAGAIKGNVLAQRKAMGQKLGDHKGVAGRLKAKQKALDAALGALENAVSGLKESLRRETDMTCNRYFDLTDGPIVEETLEMVDHYPVDPRFRKSLKDPSQLIRELHLFYMDLRQNLSRYIVEKVNIRIIAFAKEQEEILENRFQHASDAFWSLFSAALEDYYREAAKLGIDLGPPSASTPLPRYCMEETAPPAFSGFVNQCAVGRGVLLVKFGLGRLTSFLTSMKGRLGKPDLLAWKPNENGSLQDAIQLVKSETTNELLHSFQDYCSSFKSTYLHRLLDEKAGGLMESLRFRAEMAQLDFSKILKQSELEGEKRQMLIDDLTRVARTTEVMADELAGFRCAVNLEWLSCEPSSSCDSQGSV